MDVLFYCRSGYEADLLAEVEHAIALTGHYGYSKFAKNTALLHFTMPQVSVANKEDGYAQANKLLPSFESLIFARQKLIVIGEKHFETSDRVSEIVRYLNDMSVEQQNIPVFSDVFVEYADTESGKEIAKFCKKFVVPLRAKLRKSKLLSSKPNSSGPYLHLLFEQSDCCFLAISCRKDRSEYPLGIQRLKMPPDAPSRSTLKLEEAIKTFFTQNQETALFTQGMRATDLGACPGGWSYQLANRKITVEAVDHGEINEALMQTGLIEYYPQDGFLFQPQQGNVDWLVCDMIEQPTRVSELMLTWLETGKANASIFNLKLPMNKRHKVVQGIMDNLRTKLTDRYGEIIVKAKHLYHNRDEVTVLIIVNSQMVSAFTSNQ